MAVHPSKSRLREIKELLELFYLERMVHIGIALVSVVVLLGCAVFLITDKQYSMAIGMFGSTGAAAYSSGRLLKMWNDVITILYGKEVIDN